MQIMPLVFVIVTASIIVFCPWCRFEVTILVVLL